MNRFLRSFSIRPVAWLALVWALALTLSTQADENEVNPYAGVDALFVKYCLDCHSHDDPDAGLNLESFDTLMKGGQNGSPILEGDSERSPLVRLLIGFTDPNDKKRIMPPGRRDKLTELEIGQIRKWIDNGAPGPPEGWRRAINLITPTVPLTVEAPNPIHALAYSPATRMLAVGRYQQVEIIDAESQLIIRELVGHQGNVNGLAFSADGSTLFSGSGEPGLSGEIKKWNVSSGALLQTFTGHHDTIYALAISHDGTTLATGSYDQSIHLWNTTDGTLLRSLTGHQGAVFDLAFRPDDQILASASADRTIKLWNVSTGQRTDTLSQPLKEQHAVVFSQDGKKLFAGGVDNRIRIWQISSTATETTNPLLESRFAHEGTILRLSLAQDGNQLISSADDRTVKLWETGTLKEKFLLPPQPDWSPAVSFVNGDENIAIGRLDGSLSVYSSKDGKPVTPPKPEIARLVPPGIQRGTVTRVRVEGKHLSGIETMTFESADLQAALVPGSSIHTEQAEFLIFSKEQLSLGKYALTVTTAQGTSNKVDLHVDRFAQVTEAETPSTGSQSLAGLPLNVWGQIDVKGQEDRYTFQAEAGQGIVFDVAANRLGSKADLVITLTDDHGRPLASSHGFDSSADPLLFHTFADSGRYELRVGDRFLNSSADHFYRVTIGSIPFVTDVMPQLAPQDKEIKLHLIGFNLDQTDQISLKTERGSSQEVPIDESKFRFRKLPKLRLAAWDFLEEAEPNDNVASATTIRVGQNASGRIWQPDASEADVDYYRFAAEKNQTLIIETVANQLGSPIDTRIEILTESGEPIQHLLLEAVRDTAITFRPITSTAGGVRLDNWEEMALNEYLFMNGEVVKLFLAPRGPDSSWDFYPASGTRRTYFDTTATAHANFEPCYIVRPHPPGTQLVPNGLPRFPLYYQNDDHSEAQKGRDSRVYFTAPTTGNYLVRVHDTRAQESPRFVYQLLVREQSPDFEVSLSGRNPSVNRGSGRSFTVNRKRIDGFDGEIEIEFTGLPTGVTVSSPIVIEAGHHRATGTLFVDPEVTELTALDCLNIEVTASATIKGHPRIRAIENFGKIKVTDPPKIFVKLEPQTSSASITKTSLPTETNDPSAQDGPSDLPVITIEPGTTIPAQLSVRRNGHTERITFSISNLPHGVIVDNIGLNGVLMPPEVSDREIFLTAADWVEETERLCHAIANEAGGQASRPVLLRVVRPSGVTATR